MTTTFVHAKKLAHRWLTTRLPSGIRVVTKLPTPLGEASLPLVQVFRSPGGDGHVTTYPHIDLHNFGETEDEMWETARASHEAMKALAGERVDGQLVDRVNTIQDPAEQTWSAAVSRSVAVYELELRPA